MAVPLLKDPRLRAIAWRDLVRVSPLETLRELLLPAPWLLGSLYFYGRAASGHPVWMAAGMVSSYYFFLTALRQAHNAQHYTLGLPRWLTEWVMVILSLLMAGSMHAVQVTHLHHHAHCLDEADLERSISRLPWYKVALLGPHFFLKRHYHGLAWARPRRRAWWMALELLSAGALGCLAFGAVEAPAFRYHFLAMIAGQWLWSFFTVWAVHRGCDHERQPARTQRGRLKNLLACDMFYHLEHHLFPAVPNCHLAELSRRLDAALPELKQKSVY